MNKQDKNIDAGDVVIESIDKSNINKDNTSSNEYGKDLEPKDKAHIKKIIKG